MDTIHNYNSIPEVLHALMKKGTRPMSIRQLSKKLGYASDRTVGMVVQGQRELGADMLRRLANYAQLSIREKEFLSLLALRHKLTKQGKPTTEIDRQIQEFRGKEAKSRHVEPIQLQGLTRWYAFPVIEVLRKFKSPARVEAIYKYLRGTVAVQDLAETLRSLAELGYIKMDARGCFRNLADNEYIETPIDIPSATVRKIHREQLMRAIETLEEQSVTEREFIANTLMISASKIALLKKRIREVMDEVSDEFVATESEDSVAVQLNIQLYQQTKP